jgi:hypothetical protein
MSGFTNNQVLHGLRLVGVVISPERLRQIRDGYTERRARKYGTYERARSAVLEEGRDWTGRGSPVFTEAGVRKVFARYGHTLHADVLAAMEHHPRNKWEERHARRKAPSLTPPAA